jgi:Cu-Zn family superoxide dismutase
MTADTGAIQLQEEGELVRVGHKSEARWHQKLSWALCSLSSLLLIAAGVAYFVSNPRRDAARAHAIIYTGCDAAEGTRMGSLELEAEGGRTRLRCRLSGLPFGLHGLHVHESANFTEGCTSTLGHYNPSDSTHGGPLGSMRHHADFGNIMASFNETCETEVLADVALGEIVGRAFVVHEEGDDLGQGGDVGSRTTGNAGGRLGGGVIEWLK